MTKSRASKHNTQNANNFLDAIDNNATLENIKKRVTRGQQFNPQEVIDADGWTPLHYAAKRGDVDVMQYLVETCHCDINAADRAGNTPLHQAMQYDCKDIVVYLVKHSPSIVEAKNLDDETVLHHAAFYNAWSSFEYLIRNSSLNIWAITKEPDNRTAIDIAIQKKHKRIVDSFVGKLKEDPNKTYGTDKNTAFHLLAECNEEGDAALLRINAIRDLIEAKGDCTIDNALKQSPLHFAALGTTTEIAQILVKQGVDPTKLDAWGKSALMIAQQDQGSHSLAIYLQLLMGISTIKKSKNAKKKAKLKTKKILEKINTQLNQTTEPSESEITPVAAQDTSSTNIATPITTPALSVPEKFSFEKFVAQVTASEQLIQPSTETPIYDLQPPNLKRISLTELFQAQAAYDAAHRQEQEKNQPENKDYIIDIIVKIEAIIDKRIKLNILDDKILISSVLKSTDRQYLLERLFRNKKAHSIFMLLGKLELLDILIPELGPMNSNTLSMMILNLKRSQNLPSNIQCENIVKNILFKIVDSKNILLTEQTQDFMELLVGKTLLEKILTQVKSQLRSNNMSFLHHTREKQTNIYEMDGSVKKVNWADVYDSDDEDKCTIVSNKQVFNL